MTINTALTVPIILFKIIFIALFHVLGHADHKNDFYLIFIYFFILFIFLLFSKYASESRGGSTVTGLFK